MTLSRKDVQVFIDEIVYGYECPLCRLTDHGRRRMVGNGFIVKPCHKCETHFTSGGSDNDESNTVQEEADQGMVDGDKQRSPVTSVRQPGSGRAALRQHLQG